MKATKDYKMDQKYVSFRIETLQNTETNYHKVKHRLAHDYRLGYIPQNINKDKIKDNIVIQGGNFLDNFENVLREQETRSTRKLQKNCSRFFGAIMTFSNEMTQDYQNNPNLFKKCATSFINDIQETLGTKALSVVLHLDETTPHIHLIFDNIDTQGKTVQRQLTRNNLSELQTLMGSYFEPMGYKRGISAIETKATHVSTKTYKELKKIEDKIKANIKNLKQDSLIFEKFEKQEPMTPQEFDIFVKKYVPTFFKMVENDKQKQALNTKIDNVKPKMKG